MGSINSIMKVSLCHYSGYKIHPGHGKTMVRVDGKVYHFLDSKCERAHLMKRNPRNTTWTVLYRRKHKKGQEEEQTKKTQKFQRAIVGASLTEILAKRNQKPEVRKAQRDQAIKAAKEKTKAAKAQKKAAAAPSKPNKAVSKSKAARPQKAAPRVGGKS